VSDRLLGARLMLIDDESEFSADIAAVLSSHYEVELVHDPRDAVQAVERLHPDVVLLDLDFGDGQRRLGLEILERISSDTDAPPVIMLTGTGDVSMVVESVKAGAFHYVCKPPDLAELFNVIRLALADTALRLRISTLQSELQERSGTVLIAEDPAMKRVLRDVERVAPTDTTILLTGESGVGKDVLADLIHRRSGRSAGPMVRLNCGAVPDTLIESELFGHEKGAFTGAEQRRRGRFELAATGTLFLDEIAESPLTLQPKLLRVLESREFERLGGEQVLKADVRLIAATNKDLRAEVDAKHFREDLYFRLNVFRVHVPPLRERCTDILPLARHFLSHHAVLLRRDVRGFSNHAEKALLEHSWPGNVRELGNMIEQAVIRCRGSVLGIGNIHLDDLDVAEHLPLYRMAKTRHDTVFKRRYLAGQLERTGGNVTRAAQLSGMLRQAFQKMMRDCDLKAEDFRDR